MFEQYSLRAIRVVFVTRSKAGERGSGTLDIGDFVLAFVLEDQGKFLDYLSAKPSPGDVVIDELEVHVPFLQPEAAARLLLGVEHVLTHSTRVPTSVELSVSAELYQVFQFAEELRKELGHEHIQPLHLLAGVFEEKSGVYSDQLREGGVTQELVLGKLREAGEKH